MPRVKPPIPAPPLHLFVLPLLQLGEAAFLVLTLASLIVFLVVLDQRALGRFGLGAVDSASQFAVRTPLGFTLGALTSWSEIK
jgi:hypothetical protein